MTTAEQLITVEKFYALPDPPEGGKMELVDGKVVTMSPVGRRHGVLASRLDRALGGFVDEHRLGEVGIEVGFRLVPGRNVVRAPDVHWVSVERLTSFSDEGFYDSYPDLAVEVVSPEDRDSAVSAKVQQYLAAGTNRVWVVRPATKSVTVHRPDGSARTYGLDATLTSEDAGFAVAGFALDLVALFA